jgi:hypothetical protein
LAAGTDDNPTPRGPVSVDILHIPEPHRPFKAFAGSLCDNRLICA